MAAGMTSLRLPGHLFACLLLLWITADFMDPFTPGVFFFENDAFFVDGVIQARSNAAPTPSMPVLSAEPVDTDAEKAAVKVGMITRPLRSPVVWKNLKHDDSMSASYSSPDSPAAQS